MTHFSSPDEFQKTQTAGLWWEVHPSLSEPAFAFSLSFCSHYFTKFCLLKKLPNTVSDNWINLSHLSSSLKVKLNNIPAVIQRNCGQSWVWTEISSCSCFHHLSKLWEGSSGISCQGVSECVDERENIRCTVKRRSLSWKGRGTLPCLSLCVSESAEYGVIEA